MNIFESEYNVGGIQFTSGLSKWFDNSSPLDRVWNLGLIAIGMVTKVHPKRYTANVTLTGSGNRLEGSRDLEGNFACRICTSFAGFSEKYEAPYGEILPINEGDLVVVGFFNNNSATPVILGRLHDISESIGVPNYKNILPEYYLEDSTAITDYLHISPIQDFKKIDEKGNFELSSHTKSFIVGKEGNLNEESFDYENLSVKYPTDKSGISAAPGSFGNDDATDTTIGSAKKTIHVASNQSRPKKYLAVFRDKFEDAATNWLRIFIDAGKSIFKIIQSKRTSTDGGLSTSSGGGTATVIEIDSSGRFRVRRNLDTYKYKGVESQHYSEVQVGTDGSIFVLNTSQGKNNPNMTMKIDGNTGKISVVTVDKLNITAKKDIKIQSEENIKLTAAGKVSIQSKGGILMGSEKNVVTMAKESVAIQSAEKAVGIRGFKGCSVGSGVGDAGGTIDITQNGGIAISGMKIKAGAIDSMEIMALNKTSILSPNIKSIGNKEHLGNDNSTGVSTHVGARHDVGSITANGGTQVVDGDPDTQRDITLGIICNMLINIALNFAISLAIGQILSAIFKSMPRLAALIATVAKAYAYYKVGTSLVKSIEQVNHASMEFKGNAADVNSIAKGNVIEVGSPLKDGLAGFVKVRNTELEKLDAEQYGDLYAAVDNLETSMYETFDAVVDLVALSQEMDDSDDSDSDDDTENVDVDLPDAQEFTTVNRQLYTTDTKVVSTLPSVFQGERETETSVVTQMRYLITPQSQGGLGLDLEGAMTSGASEIESVINCITVFWDGFSQRNVARKTFEFVCSKDYITSVKTMVHHTGVKSNGQKIDYNDPTTHERFEDGVDGKDSPNFRNLNCDAIPLSDEEKNTIIKILEAIESEDSPMCKDYMKIRFKLEKFEANAENVGSGYVDNLENIINMSQFYQEGDVYQEVDDTVGSSSTATNLKSTKYVIENALDQLNDYVYDEPSKTIDLNGWKYNRTDHTLTKIVGKNGEVFTQELTGWQVKVRELEEAIDSVLGTNSQRFCYGIFCETILSLTAIQSLTDYPRDFINFSDLIDEHDKKDCFIDLAVKRYLFENGLQAIEHVNFTWKVERCKKDHLTEPDETNEYSVDYACTVNQETQDKKLAQANQLTNG